MGVVAPHPPRIRQPQTQSQLPLYGAAGLYCGVVAVSVFRHEPWADEAQAWLLARDSSPVDLWIRLLHYEGTPGIWHTLLHLLINVGLPYGGLNILSGLLGLAAAWLLFRYAPFPLAIRALLPFTFFLAYQYPVVARSYSVLPVLVFGCALAYKSAIQRIGLFTLILSLMAGLSLHALMLSVSIWMAFHVGVARRWRAIDALDRQRLLIAGTAYIACVALVIAAAWPVKDVAFPYHLNLSFGHFFSETGTVFNEAFAGQPVVSAAVVVLSIPFLWRGGTLWMFLLASVLLCAVSALVYANVWHYGILFLAWLFAVWTAASSTKPTWPILTSLAIVIVFQGFWTFASCRYDWRKPYSGSREAAIYLRNNGITGKRLFGLGFTCAAVEPYFHRNVFANFDRSYWDWSTRNRTDNPVALLSSSAPDFVLLGYKTAEEKTRWTNLVNLAGYQGIRHFEGNVFWKTRILQPESFDLYGRGTPRRMASVVAMGNLAVANQLLSGFYGIENNAWRWTARKFAVALETPPGAPRNGALLLLHFYVSEAQASKLGALTLNADMNTVRLGPQTYTGSGTFTYSREISPSVLQQQVVPVEFAFDKATPPSGAEARELSVVVTSVELKVKQ